jgi:hypothetical protein
MSYELPINSFKCPIQYSRNLFQVSPNIQREMELLRKNIKTNTDENDPLDGVYHIIFPSDNFSTRKIVRELALWHTTDTSFLKATQSIIGSTNKIIMITEQSLNDTMDLWSDIKTNIDFHGEYMYVGIEPIRFINKYESAMKCLGAYTIFSPIVSLSVPIIGIILAFIIMFIRGVTLSIAEYVNVFRSIVGEHSITKIYDNFISSNILGKLYGIFCLILYIFTSYQNILGCTSFYNNLPIVSSHIHKISKYISTTIPTMTHFAHRIKKLKNKSNAYIKFRKDLLYHIDVLKNVLVDLRPALKITSEAGWYAHISSVGETMATFYRLYESSVISESMNYSFNFYGYLNVIQMLQQYVGEGKMNMSVFDLKCVRKLKAKKLECPTFMHNCIDDKSVANDVDMGKNIIITGPNASGKTTMLRSIMLNVLLSQQFGCGCYKSMTIHPFEYMHCYLNIPDTLERDSLFQAEARRCHDILTAIQSNSHGRHLCIFDELYSGTNPEEATRSTVAYLRFLSENRDVHFAITTHYKHVSSYFDARPNHGVQTQMMVVNNTNNSFDYLYKMEPGISTVLGGLKTLKDIGYPKKMIDFFEDDEIGV